MNYDFDVCIVGSGAGAGPVAKTLAQKGLKVVVLEKGPWYKTKDLFKDEIAATRRSVYTPNLRDERHVIEQRDDQGKWQAESTYASGWDFWNGNMVGGSSNLMSGYFHRLKPQDFRLVSEFGAITGANNLDWPISYDDLEPYYTRVENEIGVSGRIVQHPNQEPRSTPDFPYPPLSENIISQWIDKSCRNLGYHPMPTPRAILPYPALNRIGCSYSDYCGSYGCATDAKSSSRVAVLRQAVESGNCEIRPHSIVHKLISDQSGKVIAAEYSDKDSVKRKISAKIFVVACQAVETSRLLLLSDGPKHPKGLGNKYNQVGKNLVFSGGGSGMGDIHFDDFTEKKVENLKVRGLFVNRSLQDWYFIDDPEFGGRAKGGTIDFLFRHSNPIGKANSTKWQNGELIWGHKLKRKLEKTFKTARYLKFEVFNDWLPTDNCFVTLDPNEKDKWGVPVAKIRIGYHQHDLKVGEYLSQKALQVLKDLGAKDIEYGVSGSPPTNLMAGGCRFGHDPKTSVLDPDCRVHDAENVFVTDGSFMPTGGSVPYTWTIYANSFRVGDKIAEQF